MMPTDDLDRTLGTWFETDAAGPEPTAVLATVLERTRVRAPRAAWVVLLRAGGIGARTRTRPWTTSMPVPALLLLGLLLVLAIAAAAIVGGAPSPLPAPALSNGPIAFATNPSRDTEWATGGERRDIFLTGEGVTPRVIVGSEDDRLSQACPRFSPDGSLMAYGLGDESPRRPESGRAGRAWWPVTNRAVVVLEVAPDGTPSEEVTRFSLGPDLGPLPCPEWSPDGSHLAFFTGTHLRVGDIMSGATTMLPVAVSDDGSGVTGWASMGDLDWSPDGTAIAVAEEDRIRSMPIDGGPETWLVIAGAIDVDHVAVGRLAYVVSDEGGSTLHAVELATGEDRLLDTDVSGGAVASPDGTRLAFTPCIPGPAEGGGRGCTWDTATVTVMGVDGTNVSQVRASIPEAVGGMLWSPDGRRLLVFDLDTMVSVGVSPGEGPEVVYPVPLGLDFEWMGENNVSWQAVWR